MTTHSLKVWPQFYDALECGDKLFELRENDRDFKVDDWLKLREWKPADIEKATPADFTGRRVLRQISYVTHADDVAWLGAPASKATGAPPPANTPLAEGYVILGLRQPIVELGVKLQGRRLFIESTKTEEGDEATQYLVELMQFVERIRLERKRR